MDTPVLGRSIYVVYADCHCTGKDVMGTYDATIQELKKIIDDLTSAVCTWAGCVADEILEMQQDYPWMFTQEQPMSTLKRRYKNRCTECGGKLCKNPPVCSKCLAVLCRKCTKTHYCDNMANTK